MLRIKGRNDMKKIMVHTTDVFSISCLISVFFFMLLVSPVGTQSANAYTVVDTGQVKCYNNSGEISCPQPAVAFYGQDAQYQGTQPSYVDNGDGTVSDLNTGLMWQQEPGFSEFEGAFNICSMATTGGYSDWRVPTIKELYSLIDFSGCTGTGSLTGGIPYNAVPYINTEFFTFYYGTEVNEPGTGDRYIDSQYISSTVYTSTVFDTEPAFFGVNFADGRIKGYPQNPQRVWFLRCVRGGSYGSNIFEDNLDGTISDMATGLMWMQLDSGSLGAGDSGAMDWEDSLTWCENLVYSGYDDWKLPSAKEIQSIVDYTRSPDATGSAAIDPVFNISSITNEAGNPDYPYFWTSTTHLDGMILGSDAVYLAFGRAMGYMNGKYMDVHGAGAQRGDPKDESVGSAACGQGPQGDCRRIYNFARCVRLDLNETPVTTPDPSPEIKANGSDGSVTLNTSNTLSISVSFTAGSSSGVHSDWWVAADTPFGWHYYLFPHGWYYAGDLAMLPPTYQGALFDVGTFEILNITKLPPGTYVFYFAVDTVMNGLIDFDHLYYEGVVVNII